MDTVYTTTGSCSFLEAFGNVTSSKCEGRVVSFVWTDRRVSFSFATVDGVDTVTFSGDGNKQNHQGNDTIVQPVDSIFDSAASKSSTFAATGTCKFPSVANGAASIVCEAETPSGKFSARFMSNGEPPTVKSAGQ
ncbi:MAG: hypothetical protein ACRYHQ_03950 [Janthinobacterium lividum]